MAGPQVSKYPLHVLRCAVQSRPGQELSITADASRERGPGGEGDQEKISPHRKGGPGLFCITHDIYFRQKPLFCMGLGFLAIHVFQV